ncbi:MAG TPA: hypothetical protein VKB51_01415 [bacterium]|nr:hypothetical protein [bacterium]
MVGALAAVCLLWAGSLHAEPYFTVRDGYKCSKCHVNKTGGHARTDYAKVYMETRNSMSSGGAGSTGVDYGHGRLSDAFSLSADLRAVAQSEHNNTEATQWQFGRPSSCESCHTANSGGGKRAEIYAQFQPLPGKASIVMTENLLPQPSTREVYGLLEFDRLNGYLKVGKFRMPTALHNTFDDPFYHGAVDVGSTDEVGLEAVRGDGLEMGIEPGPYSVSLSITNPADYAAVLKGKREVLNAYAVGRLGLVGLMYYVDPRTQTENRTFMGLYGGASIGRVTGLVEVDQINTPNVGLGSSTDQQALLAEVNFLLSRGQNIKWQYEAFDPNTSAEKDIRDRNSLIYEPFITPYLQFRGGVRRWAGPRQTPGANGTTVFAEVHLIY